MQRGDALYPRIISVSVYTWLSALHLIPFSSVLGCSSERFFVPQNHQCSGLGEDLRAIPLSVVSSTTKLPLSLRHASLLRSWQFLPHLRNTGNTHLMLVSFNSFYFSMGQKHTYTAILLSLGTQYSICYMR